MNQYRVRLQLRHSMRAYDVQAGEIATAIGRALRKLHKREAFVVATANLSAVNVSERWPNPVRVVPEQATFAVIEPQATTGEKPQ